MDKVRVKIESPTVEEMKIVAAKHHLAVTDEDLQQYTDQLDKLLHTVYERINNMADRVTVSQHQLIDDRPPQLSENPHNAWARIITMSNSAKGKLSGKTVAIKDNVSVAGVQMQVGTDFMKGFICDHNATVVDRILDAGGIIKGKAACEAMCISGSSFTSVSGPVTNPYDVTRSCGGSSSGCAALVASGAVDMAIGTDQAGSLRIPCSWTGIVGLKPTYGLVPYTGIVPIEGSLDHVGPMARTVQDCALLLEIIAGPDEGLDPRQCDINGRISPNGFYKTMQGGIRGMRIGILEEGFMGCEEDVASVVMSSANCLTSLGATVEEFSSPLHNLAMMVGIPIITEGMYSTYSNFGLTSSNCSGYQDVALHDFLFRASKLNTADLPTGMKSVILSDGYIRERYGHHFYGKALNCMRKIREDFNEVFHKYDVIVMPTVKYKPTKLPTTELSVKDFLKEHSRNTDNTFPYNAMGHPAVTVNAGYSEGLPVGMMIVGGTGRMGWCSGWRKPWNSLLNSNQRISSLSPRS